MKPYRFEQLTSLPLMGIENPMSLPFASPCASSLPLMGIENTWGSSASTFAGSISLPLMGIENYRLLRAAECSQPVLITPHGDRKPPVSRENVTVCGALCEATYHRGRATHHHSKVFVRLNHGVQRVLCSGARRSQTSDQFFPCH